MKGAPRGERRPAKVSEPFADASFDRKRLFKRLDDARRRPIVWIVAPPGAGKTTLAASYLRSRKLLGVWYRVDSSDTDAASLFYYLRSAIAPVDQSRRHPLPLWTQPTAGSLAAFARRFSEDFFDRLPPRSVLLIDDFQEAPAQSSWIEGLDLCLSAIPRGVSVIVTSRTEPPASFARRRVSGELAIVGWEDLRLSLEEAAGIAKLRAPRGRSRSPSHVRGMHELSGGLAAALVLLAASEDSDHDAARVHARRGSREVFDYFATELFERCDPETQRFLLTSAFLTSMSESTVEACGGVLAPRLLRRLRRHELFVDRFAGPEPVYRYHPLFRAFLLDRATQTLSKDELTLAKRNAARLLLESGQVEHAFATFREAGDREAMATLVAQQAPALLAQGRRQTLEQWLGSLPDEVVAQSGWLSLWRGVCAIGTAPARAVPELTRAFDALASAGDPVGSRVAWSAAVQAIMLEGEAFPRLDAWLERLETALPPAPTGLPPEVDLQMATAELLALQYREPGSTRTHDAAERALALAAHTSDLGERLMSGAIVVMYYVFFDGDTRRASAVLDVLRDARSVSETDPMVRVTMRLAESIHAWAMGREGAAIASATEGFEIAEGAGIDAWNNRLLGLGAAAALGMGDPGTAHEFLVPMAKDAPKRGRFDVGNYHYYAAWDASLRGEAARAERGLQLATEAADGVDFPLARSLARIARAVMRGEDGRWPEAHTLVREARAIAEGMGSRFLLFACCLLEAEIAGRLGYADLELLAEGLRLGRECACFNAFWLPRTSLARLSVRAIEARIEVAYVQELVRRRRLRPEVSPVHLDDWPWPVRVYALGRFDLQVDGAPVHAARSQRVPLRVLGSVIAFGRRNVRKDRVIDAIWPDAEGDAGARALDTALHRLRKLLGVRDAVVVADGCLHLDPEILWTDAGAVEELLGQAERALDGDAARALSPLERAMDRYGGKLLALEGDQPWAMGPRQKLHGRVLDVVLRVGEHLESEGQHDPALALYHRALSLDEASEALCDRLTSSYLRTGRRAEAARVRDRCRDARRVSPA